MAMDPAYVEFASDVVVRNQGEVGMHLHAWNSPPQTPLTDDDWRWQPYLIEYPDDVLYAKVAFMTNLLEEIFCIKMRSHRSGRWAFDERYAKALIKLGYLVDCSVTPRVNWRFDRGTPQGGSGTDYTHFPRHAYFIDPNNIACPGDSPLLEVPMTIQYKYSSLVNKFKQVIYKVQGKQRSPAVYWLRPSGGNLESMKHVIEQSLLEGHDYVEFMLHSSEFMPNGSPTFKNERDIEHLYDDLEVLFKWVSMRFQGHTLTEYYTKFTQNSL
ncbi:hypothetical protein NVIRPANT_00740 [Pantoea sp. Nvir]|nr:hypothetical protein NVIRPANT_00740 [Pantoea sp. Nvir]